MAIVASSVRAPVSSRSESSLAATATTSTSATTTAAATVAPCGWRSTLSIAFFITSTAGLVRSCTSWRRWPTNRTAHSAGVLLATIVASTITGVATTATRHAALYRTVYIAFGESWRGRTRTGSGTRAGARTGTGVRAAPENTSSIKGARTTLARVARRYESPFASSLDPHGCHIQKLGIDHLFRFFQNIYQFPSSSSVVRRKERVSSAGVVGSSSASNAMNVILRRSGIIKVYNKFDVVHI